MVLLGLLLLVVDLLLLEVIVVLSYQSAKHSHEAPVYGALDTMYLSYSDEKDLGFLDVVYGRSSGKTKVVVSFFCDFISESFTLSKTYTASASLWVVSYPPISLGAWIKTSDNSNLGCIQAKDRTSGRAEISSCVSVAEVAQVRVTSKEFTFYVADLAVGAELDLLIHYRDALGSLFHEAYDAVQIDADTNYPGERAKAKLMKIGQGIETRFGRKGSFCYSYCRMIFPSPPLENRIYLMCLLISWLHNDFC
ncbi:hypothetical protein MKW98_007250 [Papaver atlanticum]|uniref:Uncharacterized protein n=1 Tax=Papaver atlanticum TaxID=357466 RepID=A0AAD4XTD3_9MAGN|nr:hypothetical protein MKW98_007250 [Papaver atlanticum]